MEKKSAADKAEGYRTILEEAKHLISEALNKIRTSQDGQKVNLEDQLQKIKEKLQLQGEWNLDRADPETLLQTIENEVNRASSVLLSTPYDRLEELIASVSGGMVRYGLHYPSNKSSSALVKGKFPVLENPAIVELLEPEQSSLAEFFISTELNAS